VLERVRAFVRRGGLIAPGQRILVAVSGGADSVALLHVLHTLSPELQLQLEVMHVHHGLRGDEADADAEFVRGFAQSLGVPFHLARIDVRAAVVAGGLSIQEAARHARLAALEQQARASGCQRVALGHHMDDQAETVLMRVIRGTGIHGLGAIPPLRGDLYVRPLLDVRRQEIEAYCAEHRLPYRHDSSNDKWIYRRNRIRHELMPLLAGYNPRVVPALARLADAAREDDAYLMKLAQGAREECRLSEHPPRLHLSQLQELPAPILWRVLWLEATSIRSHRPDHIAIGRAVSLVRQGQNGKVPLGAGLWLRLEHGVAQVEEEGEEPPVPQPAPIALPGLTHLDDWGWEFDCDTVAGFAAEELGDPYVALFDASLVKGPLYIRAPKPGDRLYPKGMSGSKKLQDIFVDAKIPGDQRRVWPVLVCGDEILWLVGLRLDRRFLSGPGTKQGLMVQARRLIVEADEL
jgi:tRNA(Ile)-lysidine synthase